MAVNRPAPALQTPGVRPISFLLDDNVSGAGSAEALTLHVRPEDLQRQDPSRVNITQTLAGAWADSFGQGVPMITISGHTGWRRDQSDEDGEDRFRALRDQVFDQWHKRREQAIKKSSDPSEVQLIFSDALDGFTSVVAPMSFTLRRSRSRPLLLQYQIQLAVLRDGVGGFQEIDVLAGLPGSSTAGLNTAVGVKSMQSSIDKLLGYIDKAKTFVSREIVGPITAFLAKAAAVCEKVRSAVTSVFGVASSLIRIGSQIAAAGANIFRTLSNVLSLPARIKGQLIDVASEFTNLFCLMRNALKRRPRYDTYEPIYGASNCSSTSGGRPLSPLAGVNAFAVTNPAPQPPIVGVTPDAQASLSLMATSDVALAPLPAAVVARSAGIIAEGVQLA